MAKKAIKKTTTRKKTVKKKAVKKKTVKISSPKKKAANKKIVKKNKKPAAKTSAKSAHHLTLKSVLAINDAKRLYAEIANLLETKESISIDASVVEMVDTAILQLLSAFITKAHGQHIEITWHKPSKEFLSRSDMLNLTNVLGLQAELA